MKDTIINHMNHDHMDALMVLVRYHNGKEDVNNAKMLDVDNRGMKILVNEAEEVFVPFGKDTELSEVKDELIDMLKTARTALGIEKKPGGHMNEAVKYISEFGSVVLGTVNAESEPNVTYAPYLRYEDKNYIYISKIGVHYDNLKNNGKLELLFLEDEAKAKAVTVRQRVRFKAQAVFLERDEKFGKIMDAFEEKAGNTMKIMRDMTDFHLVELIFLEGSFVKGFGQAYTISESGEMEPLTSDKLRRTHESKE